MWVPFAPIYVYILYISIYGYIGFSLQSTFNEIYFQRGKCRLVCDALGGPCCDLLSTRSTFNESTFNEIYFQRGIQSLAARSTFNEIYFQRIYFQRAECICKCVYIYIYIYIYPSFCGMLGRFLWYAGWAGQASIPQIPYLWYARPA